MSDVFKTVEYLLFQKEKNRDDDFIQTFNPWLTSRMVSFYNGGIMVEHVNDTLNLYGNIFENVENQFLFYKNIIPTAPKSKIHYIKKAKTEKIEGIPIPEFYSKREIDLFENLNKYHHE